MTYTTTTDQLMARIRELKARLFELEGLCFMAHLGGAAFKAVQKRLGQAGRGEPKLTWEKEPKGSRGHLCGCPLREDWGLFKGKMPACRCAPERLERACMRGKP